jgi:phage terminase small subunit
MTKASNKTKQPEQFKQLPKLTRKQAAFVKELVENPKQSATQAVLKTYNVTSNHSAEVIASENLRKPEIVSHLNDYNDIAENTITNTIIDYKNSDNIKQRTLAVTTAQWLHDKVNGKATIRTENTNLNINIEQLLNDM